MPTLVPKFFVGKPMKTPQFCSTTWTTLLVALFHNVHSWSPALSPSYSKGTSLGFSGYRADNGSLCNHHRYCGALLPTLHQSLIRKSIPRNSLICRHFSSSGDMRSPAAPSFEVGDKIQVEVTSFGPLGASVAVVGIGHGAEVELLPVDAEPYGIGLISQQEISFFRQARDNVDVVRGEVLPAYVLKVREEDGKLNIGLRAFGGKAKSDDVSAQILDRLKWAPGGTLPVGDKSPPAEITKEFPGVSKAVFKKAVGALYKKGLVSPSPNSIALTNKPTDKYK